MKIDTSMAVRICHDYGLSVTQKTIRSWCREHGIGKKIAGRWVIDYIRLLRILGGEMGGNKALADSIRLLNNLHRKRMRLVPGSTDWHSVTRDIAEERKKKDNIAYFIANSITDEVE